MFRYWVALGLVAGLGLQSAVAEDLYFADANSWPGKIWLSRNGGIERPLHARDPNPLSSAPGMIPRLSQVCVIPGGKLFLCSGLDGFIFSIVDGRHEVVIAQGHGQIRDLVAGENDHTLYFSVVPTPQNGAPLADGKIYRYDLYSGGPNQIATVKQNTVGNEFWGTFSAKDGDLYVATLGESSRVYRLQGDQPELVWKAEGRKISGMSFDAAGDLLFTSGGKQIYRVRNFRDVDTVLELGRNVTEVAVPAGER